MERGRSSRAHARGRGKRASFSASDMVFHFSPTSLANAVCDTSSGLCTRSRDM